MEEATKPKQPSISPWSHGLNLLKAVRVKMIYLSLVGMAIPLFLSELYLIQFSLNSTANSDTWLNSSSAPPFLTYLTTLGEFFNHYALISLLPYVFVAVTQLALIDVCLGTLERSQKGGEKLWGLWVKNLPFLPRMLIATLFLVIGLSSLFLLFWGSPQALIYLVLPAFLFIVTLCYAVPFRIKLGRGAVAAIRDSIKLRYVLPGRVGLFGLFFQIMAYEFLAFLYISFGDTLILQLERLDEILSLPRDLIYSPDTWPWSLSYLVGLALKCSITGIVLGMFAVFTSSFYHIVSAEKPNLTAIGEV